MEGVVNGKSTGWQVIAGVAGGDLYGSNNALKGAKLFKDGNLVGIANFVKPTDFRNADYNYFFHRQGSYYFLGDGKKLMIANFDAYCPFVSGRNSRV
jgi:hypothetical protein